MVYIEITTNRKKAQIKKRKDSLYKMFLVEQCKKSKTGSEIKIIIETKKVSKGRRRLHQSLKKED